MFHVKEEHRSFQKGRAFFSYYHNTTNCNKFKEFVSISEKKRVYLQYIAIYVRDEKL